MQDLAPLAASTVILLRDGPSGVQTFLMRRHGRSGFMGGATVFPGGKVDPLDAQAPISGRTGRECAEQLGLADAGQAQAFFVAAARELHEEARVLLFRDRDGALPTGEVAAALTAELDALRDGHRIAAADHHRLLRERALVPALDLLVPFAHWVTPRIEPRRFDTFFFAALSPAGQRAGMDGFESTAARWCTPAEALDDNRQGGPTILPPPTLHTLARLDAMQGDAATRVKALGDAGVGPRIEPHFEADTDMGPVICLPGDPLHPDTTDAHPAGPGLDRFALRDGRFRRVQGPVGQTPFE